VVTAQKDKYIPEAKFSTWLFTIAHNICIDRLRKKRNIFSLWQKKDKDTETYEEWDIPDTKFMPNVAVESRDVSKYVKNAIDKLPFISREAIILREYHNLSYEEISKVLHCSINKVKVLIFRAREKLRAQLLPLLKEAGNV
jgi:RNA polymerase sigma-70 factor (ECF subfamily)